MTVSLIAAVAANRVIGRNGKLPWRLPDDMRRFARITAGHAVVMGRATFESLRRPLPGRRNIVLTRSHSLALDGCDVAHGVEEALTAATSPSSEEVFVIGGEQIYQLFLPLARRLYITWIDIDVPGDTLFPEVRWTEWRIVAETPAASDPCSPWPNRFVDYERIMP